jgi:hypothetical protein
VDAKLEARTLCIELLAIQVQQPRFVLLLYCGALQTLVSPATTFSILQVVPNGGQNDCQGTSCRIGKEEPGYNRLESCSGEEGIRVTYSPNAL